MSIKSDLNELTNNFINKISEVGLINIVFFLLFSSLISGILLGTFEFIERSYATGYILDFGSKLIGIIYASSWLALFSIIIGTVFSLIITLTLRLMLYWSKTTYFEGPKIAYLWFIPIIVFSFIGTYFINYFYFLGSNSSFTTFFLFNKWVLYSVVYRIMLLLAVILAALVALHLESKKQKSFIKSFLPVLISSAVIFISVTYFTHLDNIILGWFNSIYKLQLSIYYSSPIAVILSIFAIVIILASIMWYILILIIPKLWKFNPFKGLLFIILLVIFSIFYLFTVNYLVGQSFYVQPIGEIHYYTGLICMLPFLFLTIYILYFAKFTPSKFKQFNPKYTLVVLVLFIVLLAMNSIYLKPQSQRLKAFIDKSCIIQKHLTYNWLFPLLNMNIPKQYTLPNNGLCISSKNSTASIELKKKPDILLISIDALRTDLMLEKKYAPNINKFIDNSYFFVNNYSPATHTPASLSSIANSRYFATPNTAIPPTLASLLVNNSYRTVAFVADNLSNPKLIMDKTYINDVECPSPIIKGYETVYIPKKVNNYVDIKMLNIALKYLRTNKSSKPLLAWLHFYQLHEIPVESVFKNIFSSKSFKLEYYKRLKETDTLFGQYIKYLKDNDLYGNSLIVLFSDHGEEIKEHSSFFHTFSLYNELIKVPLAFKLPGQMKGEQIDLPVSSLDLVPTIIDYAEGDVQKLNFCGESLMPLITKTSQQHKLPISTLYRSFYYRSKTAAQIPGAVLMNKKPLKYYVNELNKYSIVDNNNTWKLIYNLTPEYYELYNLQEDPLEKNNLADKYPQKVKTLLTRLEHQLTKNK